MFIKNEKCIGNIRLKERHIYALLHHDWQLEKHLMIGKMKKPRCFKNVDINIFAVEWKVNKPAWMDSDVMKKYLLEWVKR